MAGNKEVLDLPPVPTPDGGALYIVKGGVDHNVPVGGPFGLGYTDAAGLTPLALIPNLPASRTTSGTFSAARIPGLDTSKITTGIFDVARVPDLSASKITSGTFANARIAAGNVTQHQLALSIGWGQLTGVPATFTPSAHTHSAADITSGTLNVLRIPNLDTGKITTGTFANARIASGNVTQHQGALSIGWSQLTSIPVFATRWPSWTEVTAKPTTFAPSAHTHAAADITSGTLADARIPNLAASKITSGVFPIARLATGTPTGTKFIRDDGVLAVPGTSSTAWGGITGTLSNQTDLQTALNGKASASHTHAAGDVTSGTFANARISQASVTQHQAALGTITSTANVLVRRDASADIFGRKFVGEGATLTTSGIDLATDTSETSISKGLRFTALNGIQSWAGAISIIINGNAHLFGPTSYNSPGTIKGRLQTTTANVTTTLNASHLNQIVEKTNTTAYTYTLAASLGVAGDVITILNSGTVGDITIARDTGVALYKGTTNANVTVTPGTTLNLVRSATANRWIAA